jgi:hypothetical protein
MTTQYTLSSGLTSVVLAGGTSIQVATSNMTTAGGYIVNPLAPIDQGIHIAESLFINLAVPAQAALVNTNTELPPGDMFIVPPGSSVWINAKTSGHRFTAVFKNSYDIQYPPSPVAGNPGTQTSPIGSTGGPFPPPGVTGLTDVIPSYLYQEYSDDDDLQEFVTAQNEMQQDYVDTFNALDLPIYPGPIVSGKLLDWVGQGLYGMARPAIGSGVPLQIGPLNTWGCNMPGHAMAVIHEYFQYEDWLPSINGLAQLSVGDVVVTDDDTYRRILTWHFYKGDGNYFSTRWLKRRVWRFCYDMNGIPNDIVVDPLSQDFEYKYIADTGQISVSLGVNRNCTIRFVLGVRTVTGGGMLNAWGPNGFEPAIHNKNPPWDIGTDKTPSGGGVNWQFNAVLNSGHASSSNNGILVITGSSPSGSPIVAGMIVHGAGIPSNTVILWQISGTIGRDGTYQIAQNFTISSVPVTFTTNTWVNLGGGGAKVAPGGIYLNDIETTYVTLPALPFMDVFKKSVDSGALELPYQYNYTVHIG